MASSKLITVEVPSEVWKEIRIEAAKRETTLKELVNLILKDWLGKRE